MQVFLVSHTHWDREWYRTYQTFRARLVDAIDRVLELTFADEGFRFLLDGQTIVLEDYLEIRPERRQLLAGAVRAGRIAIGPWYVQPDSLLPSGEAHVRNLLEGRRVGAALGPPSRVAYTPDSFGHPAQLPQIFAGFGLGPFVYWRGNGDEIDALPAEYFWEAPDGSRVLAHHLGEGYFAASGLPESEEAAGAFLVGLIDRLAARSQSGVVLLMNGFDHAPPEAHTSVAERALVAATEHDVRRALLDDFADVLPREAPSYRGELLGGRTANLLPGVWSTRMPQKLRNRRAETALEAWAEPWSALGEALGAADERPALRAAWRELLKNQAHDSICGCSQDRVHAQMEARYDAAEELARETTTRALERIAGLDTTRQVPWSDALDVAVFNPSAHPRTDVVRFDLSPSRWLSFRDDGGGRSMAIHPLLMADLGAEGFTADGAPVRTFDDDDPARIRLIAERAPRSVELVARDVPAFGWRRFRLEAGPASPEQEDDGREIAAGGIVVRASDDGTLDVAIGDRRWTGLCALEDLGDRGDTYDFDPVASGPPAVTSVEIRRSRHASGIETLRVRRALSLPRGLAADRSARSAARGCLTLDVEARVAPGVPRVDLTVSVASEVDDHRLRLLFPTGAPCAVFDAATTFDVVRRSTAMPDARAWVHPATPTFPHQGFVAANGLMVVAPGLPEAEVTTDGVIAITLLRAVGWLARMDLKTRPQVAGPTLATPEAQCRTPFTARLALLAGLDVRAARDAETGLRAVVAGPTPLAPPESALLDVQPGSVVVSALKPTAEGDGMVLRLLNPTDAEQRAQVRLGFPCRRVRPVCLDETGSDADVALDAGGFALTVPPHALRSVVLLA